MGTKALGFGVISWAFWAPGKKQSRPDISFVPSLLRRRLSILSAGAMHVANTALQDERDIPVVFASRHGELGRTAAILEALAACEAPSPTAFSLSVHNTAAGLLSIVRNERAPATAVAAGPLTLAMGLLETVSVAASARGKALLVFAEEAPPPTYADVVHQDTVALAALVDVSHDRFRIKACAGDGGGDKPAEQAYALAALLNAEAGDVRLGDAHRAWQVQACAAAH